MPRRKTSSGVQAHVENSFPSRWKLRVVAYSQFLCIIMALGGLEFIVGDAAGSYLQLKHINRGCNTDILS